MGQIAMKWTGEDSQLFIGRDSYGHMVVSGSWPKDADNEWIEWKASKPSDLLLLSLCACSGYDVVSILKRQRQRVTGDKGQFRVPLASLGQHAEAHVGRHDEATGRGERLRTRAGAGGQVEDQVARACCHRVDHGPAPQPVQAEAGDVVDDVVAWREPVEHRSHLGTPFAEVGAESSSVLHVADHRRYVRHSPTPRPAGLGSAPLGACGRMAHHGEAAGAQGLEDLQGVRPRDDRE